MTDMGPERVRGLVDAAQLHSVRIALRGIHHEIRGQLNDIALKVEVMRAELSSAADEEAVRGRLAEVGAIVRHVGARLEATRDLVAPLDPSTGTFDASEVLAEVGDMLRPVMTHRRVTLLVKASATRVGGNRRSLLFVLLHLASSALEEMPEGGRLLMQSGCEGGRPQIRVVDTGPGVERERAQSAGPLLAARHVETEHVGLLVAGHLASEMQGTLRVEATDDGCVATLTLPAPV